MLNNLMNTIEASPHRNGILTAVTLVVLMTALFIVLKICFRSG